MASFSASSCSRWPSTCIDHLAVSARTMLDAVFGVGDARLGVDQFVSGARSRRRPSWRARRAVRRPPRRQSARRLSEFSSWPMQRAVLVFEEGGALALGVELARAAGPCRCCSRRSAPCRRRRSSAGSCRAALRAPSRAGWPCRQIRGRACAGAGRGRRLPSRDRGCGGAVPPRALRVRASAARWMSRSRLMAPTSLRLRLMSRSWSERRRRSASTFISSRRVESANSARSWSLSARNSAMVIGVAASMRFLVRRTARRQTAGMMASATRPAHSSPNAKYMMFSMPIARGPDGWPVDSGNGRDRTMTKTATQRHLSQ